MSSSGFFKVF